MFSFNLCIIGAFDLLYRFYVCAGCSMFRAHFHSGFVSKGKLQIIVVDSKRCREEPSSYEVKWSNCGDFGTGTKSTSIGTHRQLSYSGVLVPVPFRVVSVPKCYWRTSGVLVPVPQ